MTARERVSCVRKPKSIGVGSLFGWLTQWAGPARVVPSRISPPGVDAGLPPKVVAHVCPDRQAGVHDPGRRPTAMTALSKYVVPHRNPTVT